jgi:pimeloyl-ACP methyl ester carboxylesterase
VAGIIQLCPTFDAVETALLKQARHVEGAVRGLSGLRGIAYRLLLRHSVAGWTRRIDRVKAGRMRPGELKRHHIGLQWLVELLQLEPRQIYAQMRCPMLLVAGAKDVQCDPAGMQSILEVIVAPVESHLVPNLTHVLRFDEHAPSVFAYAELIKRPMAGEVLEMISRWLARQTHRVCPGTGQ